jgi:hypothetical protein
MFCFFKANFFAFVVDTVDLKYFLKQINHFSSLVIDLLKCLKIPAIRFIFSLGFLNTSDFIFAGEEVT